MMGEDGGTLGEHGGTNGRPPLSPDEIRQRIEAIVGELNTLLSCLGQNAGEDVLADRMLTVEEVSSRLGLSRKQVYRKAAEWPFTKKLSPKALRFSEAGLERWLRDTLNGDRTR